MTAASIVTVMLETGHGHIVLHSTGDTDVKALSCCSHTLYAVTRAYASKTCTLLYG
jgi:hypothetical protein